MKFKLALFLSIAACLHACNKEDEPEKTDYRETVTGKYSGIKVNTAMSMSGDGYTRDTSEVEISLCSSSQDSIIDVFFRPSYSIEQFSFKYSGETFLSTINYHPPTLVLHGDSLYFMHKPSLAPVWIECFTKKVE